MGQELLRIWRARRKTVVMVTHSVTEAVFLADRVLVLGARPAVVVDEVPVDLPRPRTVEVTETSDFGAVTHRVREALDRARV
jgi:NitT/TauT family transport system ATP-binding protein